MNPSFDYILKYMEIFRQSENWETSEVEYLSRGEYKIVQMDRKTTAVLIQQAQTNTVLYLHIARARPFFLGMSIFLNFR